MSGIDGHSTSAPLAARPAGPQREPAGAAGRGDRPSRGSSGGSAGCARRVRRRRRRFTLDGIEIEAFPGETILQAAARHNVEIPRLCYMDGMRPTATAARAWSRSRASACSRRRAAAGRPPGMNVMARASAR
jgi:hypothetical protein